MRSRAGPTDLRPTPEPTDAVPEVAHVQGRLRSCAALAAAAVLAIHPRATASPAAAPEDRPRIQVWLNVRGSARAGLYAMGTTPMPSGRGSAARVRAVSTLLCESPCGRRLELPQQELFIGGPGLTNSDGFTLHGIDGPAVIDVRPGRSGLRVLGWVAAMVGAAGLVAGATTMSFGDEDRAVLRAGGITLGVAIPVLVLGGILVATGRTRASVRAKTRAE